MDPDFLALLGLGGGAGLLSESYKDLGKLGREAFQRFGEGYTDPDTGEFTPGLAGELTGMLEFQPYTVTTATGGQFGMTTDPTTGQTTYQLDMSPDEQALQQELLKQATSFYGQAATPSEELEQDVLGRMRELRAPAEEQARAELEQRLAAQGRLGTRTAMFGGTPEQLAIAKAEQQRESEDILRAMEFARADQDRQAKLGAGMLEASYLPQGQLLAALQPGMTTAERQRQALSEQAQTYGETYASAINALLSAGMGQADIIGNVGSGLVSRAAAGLFS
jgi:hypothetical protein